MRLSSAIPIRSEIVAVEARAPVFFTPRHGRALEYLGVDPALLNVLASNNGFAPLCTSVALLRLCCVAAAVLPRHSRQDNTTAVLLYESYS